MIQKVLISKCDDIVLKVASKIIEYASNETVDFCLTQGSQCNPFIFINSWGFFVCVIIITQ